MQKVENFTFIWQAGTISRAFQTVLTVQEVRCFFFRFLINYIRNVTENSPLSF